MFLTHEIFRETFPARDVWNVQTTHTVAVYDDWYPHQPLQICGVSEYFFYTCFLPKRPIADSVCRCWTIVVHSTPLDQKETIIRLEKLPWKEERPAGSATTCKQKLHFPSLIEGETFFTVAVCTCWSGAYPTHWGWCRLFCDTTDSKRSFRCSFNHDASGGKRY